MIFDVATCKNMLLFVANGILSNVDMLNEADKLGDSDHGSGMEVGFTAVVKKLSAQEFTDLGSLFKSCGMAIMMSSGGASGAIFGTFFKDGAKALENLQQLDSTSFSEFLKLGLASVMKRGKANYGDKTMLDALKPAVDITAANIGLSIGQIFKLCAQAAKEGSEATKNMVASFGRMKNLGERTLGYADPGSITVALIFSYMSEFTQT
ncbi:MAG: dihydroxyacetone kinase subunit DhaL [Sphaerochaetaceae bacterium]|jgi:dihydroxyacetone kinase-like protein|nr:dihydroxyacetone kinase subunit DhaL [Sphaerochaetaceae bacterium]NLO60627.1 dihydroxyacetone kinase subunit L [Spirochaetales bacterium]MDD2406619.1 dihydroxyacetone kinase subunit DhaL [Sphaerochaetaceae bacterium]MDD3670119.1 dihydroxyacetone kinase subunit DhaL [Sphaerochaetaceae bacterium]MDD4258720.1 dihydroxyacetone kinase subunit DhaL [Sphaerochaetaceae bacterium]